MFSRFCMVLVAMFCLVTKITSAQSTMLRLDTEQGGVFTFWVAQEEEIGFTAEAIASTAGWGELDLGGTFSPHETLTILTMSGVVSADKSLASAVPILLVLFQKGEWYGESWNLGQINVREPSESIWYTKLFMTGYCFGPSIEAVVGREMLQFWVGGIFARDLGPFHVQLSVMGDTRNEDSIYRLSVVKFF